MKKVVSIIMTVAVIATIGLQVFAKPYLPKLPMCCGSTGIYTNTTYVRVPGTTNRHTVTVRQSVYCGAGIHGSQTVTTSWAEPCMMRLGTCTLCNGSSVLPIE